MPTQQIDAIVKQIIPEVSDRNYLGDYTGILFYKLSQAANDKKRQDAINTFLDNVKEASKRDERLKELQPSCHTLASALQNSETFNAFNEIAGVASKFEDRLKKGKVTINSEDASTKVQWKTRNPRSGATEFTKFENETINLGTASFNGSGLLWKGRKNAETARMFAADYLAKNGREGNITTFGPEKDQLKLIKAFTELGISLDKISCKITPKNRSGSIKTMSATEFLIKHKKNPEDYNADDNRTAVTEEEFNTQIETKAASFTNLFEHKTNQEIETAIKDKPPVFQAAVINALPDDSKKKNIFNILKGQPGFQINPLLKELSPKMILLVTGTAQTDLKFYEALLKLADDETIDATANDKQIELYKYLLEEDKVDTALLNNNNIKSKIKLFASLLKITPAATLAQKIGGHDAAKTFLDSLTTADLKIAFFSKYCEGSQSTDIKQLLLKMGHNIFTPNFLALQSNIENVLPYLKSLPLKTLASLSIVNNNRAFQIDENKAVRLLDIMGGPSFKSAKKLTPEQKNLFRLLIEHQPRLAISIKTDFLKGKDNAADLENNINSHCPFFKDSIAMQLHSDSGKNQIKQKITRINQQNTTQFFSKSHQANLDNTIAEVVDELKKIDNSPGVVAQNLVALISNISNPVKIYQAIIKATKNQRNLLQAINNNILTSRDVSHDAWKTALKNEGIATEQETHASSSSSSSPGHTTSTIQEI